MRISLIPANIYLLTINITNTRKWGEIYPKLTIKTLERHQWCQSCSSAVFIVNFEHISQLFQVFLLLNLNKWVQAGMFWLFSNVKSVLDNGWSKDSGKNLGKFHLVQMQRNSFLNSSSVLKNSFKKYSMLKACIQILKLVQSCL